MACVYQLAVPVTSAGIIVASSLCSSSSPSCLSPGRLPYVSCHRRPELRSSTNRREVDRFRRRCSSVPSDETVYLGDLRVPRAWVVPEVAAEEAEWLRGALHQWLDDEFCPEPANEEISKRCAKVFYYCLLEQQLDVGDILMQMVRQLETFSFKESFHGAFSSANAAIDLITKRMRSLENNS